MRYVLKRDVLGESLAIELTEPEYREIVEARRLIIDCMDFEQLFEMLLDSFRDVEELLSLLALRHAPAFHASRSWANSMGALGRVSHRITNFLSCASAYVDRSKKFANRFDPNGHLHAAIKLDHTQAFDRSFGYMVCYGLRNHTMHAGTCVHWLDTRIRFVDNDTDQIAHCYSVVPQVSLNRLRDNKEFRRKTLEEMVRSGRGKSNIYGLNFDLPPLLREYMSELSTMHLFVRAFVSDRVRAAERVILSRIRQWKTFSQTTSALGLGVSIQDDRHIRISDEILSLTVNPIRLRRALTKKNAEPGKFDQLMNSNQTPATDGSRRRRVSKNHEAAAPFL